jgi:hypothetical protein
MARVIRFQPQKERNGMRVGGPEMIVFAMMAIGAFFGVRYYFNTYLKSPSYALGQFIGAVKAGSPERQFELMDEKAQKVFGSARAYAKEPLARGYAARIENFTITAETPNPKNPDEITIKADLVVRGGSKGKQLYQSSSQSVKDTYTLAKNAKGEWRVVIAKSKLGLLEVEPTPPGDPITE